MFWQDLSPLSPLNLRMFWLSFVLWDLFERTLFFGSTIHSCLTFVSSSQIFVLRSDEEEETTLRSRLSFLVKSRRKGVNVPPPPTHKDWTTSLPQGGGWAFLNMSLTSGWPFVWNRFDFIFYQLRFGAWPHFLWCSFAFPCFAKSETLNEKAFLKHAVCTTMLLHVSTDQKPWWKAFLKNAVCYLYQFHDTCLFTCVLVYDVLNSNLSPTN